MKAPSILVFVTMRDLTMDEYRALVGLYDEPDMMAYPMPVYRYVDMPGHGQVQYAWMHSPTPYEIRRLAEVGL